MARSSHGRRRASAWATQQNSRPAPRIVRVGRPANDNVRGFSLAVKALLAVLAASLAVLAVVSWQAL